ncbi:MAG: group II intron reverse transcriptase/maturase [Halomonas sp.]|nr:group II intron reverse transcriptase/maturase [Halomonas sp.]
MTETLSFDRIFTRLQRITELAVRRPDVPLTTLAHHIDEAWLLEAFHRTRKDGAVGVDGQTGAAYQEQLEANLTSLLHRAKAGTYKAPPVRRTTIPKGDGRSRRPLGIPTFEDKVLQRAVAMVLEAVYEPVFHERSYGFRTGRSAHQALDFIQNRLVMMGGGWVLEVDVRKFFDELDHAHLRDILRQRVRDGVLLRLIDKWLKAGVMEEGQLRRSRAGTPQGGVISPVLANIFLHEVLDDWFERTVRPRLRGAAELVRYADDAVLIFKREDDARRVFDVLPKRFGKYGLRLHPEKTQLVPFMRPPAWKRSRPEGVGTFHLLGFTHYWGLSRRGKWIVKRKTAKDRLSRALKAINLWCRANRHLPIIVQVMTLRRKLTGHYAYYGITGNHAALMAYYRGVIRCWRKWLGRRSQNGLMPWQKYYSLLRLHSLPAPRMLRSARSIA